MDTTMFLEKMSVQSATTHVKHARKHRQVVLPAFPDQIEYLPLLHQPVPAIPDFMTMEELIAEYVTTDA